MYEYTDAYKEELCEKIAALDDHTKRKLRMMTMTGVSFMTIKETLDLDLAVIFDMQWGDFRDLRDEFRVTLLAVAAVFADNAEEKGDSWATVDMPSLRGLLHKKLLEWIDAKETPEELQEIVDVCLVALMIGERLLP